MVTRTGFTVLESHVGPCVVLCGNILCPSFGGSRFHCTVIIYSIGSFLTDLRKGVDDFMGRCFHPLRSIPVSGQEVKTLVLHSHSAKTKHGFISLSLTIRGIKENVPVEVGVALRGNGWG